MDKRTPETSIAIDGPIIVGGGPSGLAVAAALSRRGVPATILERSDGIAELWRRRTYDRLTLHLPKWLCQLPHLDFPSHFPTYPSRSQFLDYLNSYVKEFDLRPVLNCTVTDARFDGDAEVWRVTAVLCRRSPSTPTSCSSSSCSTSEASTESTEETADGEVDEEEEMVVEYLSRWLVVATGENAEPVMPELITAGKDDIFGGNIFHVAEYKSGRDYKGKRVLVIGCGNSGMEVCLDLCENGAIPFLSVRNTVHVLPKEMLGKSTFELGAILLRWLPIRLVDKVLVMLANIVLGDTKKYGLKRPKIGPLELKSTTGRTPVLDAGALSFIKQGKIKVVPEVESLTETGAKFVDAKEMDFDSLVFATGYRSNVPFWLKDCKMDCKTTLCNRWKDDNGLYIVGFTGRGLVGIATDSVRIAEDITGEYTAYFEKSKIG